MTLPPRPPAIRIRWRILALLFGFALLAYLQQKSITVAAEQIMPTLHLSQLQIGWLEQAFVIGYGVFQMPGGIVGQRFGARWTFVAISVVAFVAMMALPVAPELFSASNLFLVLFGSQLLLGIAQAAIFPLSAGVMSAWFPPGRWAFVQGIQTAGMQLGAAITPVLVAPLMIMAGWQSAIVWTTLPALALIACWAWYGRNTPREHHGVGAVELAEIGAHSDGVAPEKLTAARLRQVFRNRNAVLLFVSYTFMNYVFYLIANWVFLYLVQERHLSVLESGWLATAPPLGAAIGAGLGGLIAAALCRRLGFRWGYRIVPLVAMPAAGALLLVATHMTDSYVAVAVLALCYGTVELTEGSYWGCVMAVGGRDAMTVSGFMNTGGNLGGIIGIPIVAWLSGAHLWNTAFLLGVGCAIASAVCWLGIDAEQPVFTGAEPVSSNTSPQTA
jgi:ACS family glucarate transporter-like MFS transporter